MTDTRERFDRLRAADSVDPAELDALWADLATVDLAHMRGQWRGGEFAAGHPASAVLKQVRWHGKRFGDPLDAVPLLCRDDDGDLYSHVDAGGGGEASLWMVEFRGEVTATMVYDRLPVFDHFKKVDDDTVVGIMNGKLESTFGVADLYHFWLEREQ